MDPGTDTQGVGGRGTTDIADFPKLDDRQLASLKALPPDQRQVIAELVGRAHVAGFTACKDYPADKTIGAGMVREKATEYLAINLPWLTQGVGTFAGAAAGKDVGANVGR